MQIRRYIDTCVQANTNTSMHVSKRIIYVCAAGPRHGGEYEYDELLYADPHSHSNYIAIIFRRRSFATPATGIGIGTGTGTVCPYKESGTTFVRVDIEISLKFLGTSEQVKGFTWSFLYLSLSLSQVSFSTYFQFYSSLNVFQWLLHNSRQYSFS